MRGDVSQFNITQSAMREEKTKASREGATETAEVIMRRCVSPRSATYSLPPLRGSLSKFASSQNQDYVIGSPTIVMFEACASIRKS